MQGDAAADPRVALDRAGRIGGRDQQAHQRCAIPGDRAGKRSRVRRRGRDMDALTRERAPGDARGRFVLTAAMAMNGELHEAKEACEALLRVQPGFSISWMMENLPPTGGLGERLREGLRKAGVPEK